ncbi:hypothetical protein GCM10010991_15270 [Gemmobacter aquaticus]|uniref:Transposase n=1 Tax=Gemmobacter aquaticus TaxID=490185 RepID=A0A917YKL0_9RHOB|nr:hypothetical protein GCM10010991_15270 [Gemmobacter aquaticus]
MRKSRFTEAQVIGMLKEQEAGLPTSELCRKHWLSPATFYKLKAKDGGMDLSDAKRLKQLEDENAKLKRQVAEAMFDNVVRKDFMGDPSLQTAGSSGSYSATHAVPARSSSLTGPERRRPAGPARSYPLASTPPSVRGLATNGPT